MQTETINRRLVLETILVFVGLTILANLVAAYCAGFWFWLVYLPILVFQGLWFDRFYIVGHEAAHRKLFPRHPRANEFWGGLILLPLMVPLRIYRKIHYFHHGFNRKDAHTSVLDTFVSPHAPSRLRKIYYHLLWYLAVFCGGFFLHSLVSVFLFLFVPVRWSEKVSPAFKGWTIQDQGFALLTFALGVLFHLSFYWIGGASFYCYSLGYPMLMFAWIWSMLVYIFHYDTTIGAGVRYNVRSLQHVPILSWILMNFNEHATHHQRPNIAWYELPKQSMQLPEEYQKNQNVDSLWKAIWQQVKGPNIIFIHEIENGEH